MNCYGCNKPIEAGTKTVDTLVQHNNHMVRVVKDNSYEVFHEECAKSLPDFTEQDGAPHASNPVYFVYGIMPKGF